MQKEAWQVLHSLLEHHHLYLPPTLNDSDILAHELYKLALFQLTALCQTLLNIPGECRGRKEKSLTLCACTSFPSFFADARKGISTANACSTIHARVWNTAAVFSFENRKGLYLAQKTRSIYHLDMSISQSWIAFKSTVQDLQEGQKTPKIVTSHDNLTCLHHHPNSIVWLNHEVL